jgi:hypothetical protein
MRSQYVSSGRLAISAHDGRLDGSHETSACTVNLLKSQGIAQLLNLLSHNDKARKSSLPGDNAASAQILNQSSGGVRLAAAHELVEISVATRKSATSASFASSFLSRSGTPMVAIL